MALFEYRLVEHSYHNVIEWEEGPGSMQNIVSDKDSRVVRTWKNRDEDFGNQLTASGLPGLQCDSDDGRDEYRYYLERRPIIGGEWQFVGIVKALLDEGS